MATPVMLALLIAAIALGSAASYYYVTTGQPFPLSPSKVINCGEIVSHGNFTQPVSANATEDALCFYNAYVKMENATLDLYYMGVDTGQSNNFSVTSASRVVTDHKGGFVDVKQQPGSTIYCGAISHASSNTLLIDNCSDSSSFLITMNRTAA